MILVGFQMLMVPLSIPPAMRPMLNCGLDDRVDVPGVHPMLEKRLVVLMLPTTLGFFVAVVMPRLNNSSSPP